MLFFAGGYDMKHETAGFDATVNASDSKGNQIYMVDPATGAVQWWASNTGAASLNVPEMKFSIPSELKLFDADKDGLVDAVYFGDLGGQVFRIDINNNVPAATTPQVSRVQLLAKVGQTSVTAPTVATDVDQRRFYEAPSVATLINTTTKLPYVVVAMGTGYRSHPLNTPTEDMFYVFKDNDVLRSDLASASSLQATITPADLAAVDLASTAGADMTNKMGWKMDLPDPGEKVLANPIILFNEVFFTSYVPDLASG